MIYALKTKDISDHERRLIARALPNFVDSLPKNLKNKLIHVNKAPKGKEGLYDCIYCNKGVHMWFKGSSYFFLHDVDKGCLGSDKGLSGIKNPKGEVFDGS